MVDSMIAHGATVKDSDVNVIVDYLVKYSGK